MMRVPEDSVQSPQGANPRPAMRAPQESLTPSDFVYGHVLGLGSYSKVVKAKRKDTSEVFALKIMDKKHIIRENKVKFVKMERMILDQLDFPGVVRLCFTFQDFYCLYMALECCSGGELFDQIRRKGRMHQKEVRFYAAEIVEILEYIHGQGVIHRDLKPENLLLTTDGHLKLCDFGSAKMVRPLPNGFFQQEDGDKSCTFVGTAEYVSPEVLTSNPASYGVDLWALGCIMYQMLEGRPPFKAGTEYLTFQKVMSRDFVMPPHFSPEAKDLIDRLLDLTPDKRIGAQGFDTLKSHPFFEGIDWSRLRKLVPPKTARLLKAISSGDNDESSEQKWETELGQAFRNLDVGGSASESSTSDGSLAASKSASPVNQAKLSYTAGPSSSNSPNGRSPAHSNSNSSQSGYRTAAQSSVVSPSNRSTEERGSFTSGTITDDCQAKPWQRFIQPGETLVATAPVKKHKGLLVKKLQLLLIDKPSLILVDPAKLIIAGEVPWSSDMKVRVDNTFRFKVITPNRTFNLEDLRGQAWVWKDAIETLQRRFPSYSISTKGVVYVQQ